MTAGEVGGFVGTPLSPGQNLLQAAHANTPLRELVVRRAGGSHRLRIKLEQFNPTGSIKYRTAVGLLDALDARVPLVPGTAVVESTSGNLGLALARVLAELECTFVAVVDPKLPPAVGEALRAEGTHIVRVDEADAHGGYLLTRLAKVRQLCADDPDLRWADQYNNLANPNVHRLTIAAELLRQTEGRVDAVFAAVGTGGTLVGISQGLRSAVPGIKVYAVDVRGSLVTADAGGPHLLTGIGATRKSSFLRRGHYDRALRVHDVDAFAYCRMLREDTGLEVGGSSGAILAAFTEAIGNGVPVPRFPVAVLADGGAKYRTTFYDDGWLAERGVLARVQALVGRARGRGVSFELTEMGMDEDGSGDDDG